jgi:hypothetical protein
MPKIEIEIPDNNEHIGLMRTWYDDFFISTEYHENTFFLRANKDGMISLATQLLTLAYAPDEDAHFYYEEMGCLEQGSVEFIISRIKDYAV